ncbi:MAG TPA: twin-arginine translocation signal domain-containing protein [Bryobacteraceae bacterium]|nr:twin-arginine translocation signal domain-containing protein [Bryobacteraceae bacterium]
MDRRQFVKAAAVTAAALTPARSQTPLRKMIGIQMPVGPLVEQGVDAVLDHLQQAAHVNTLFVNIFTYVRERVSVKTAQFHGGNYATVHPQYYKDALLRPQDMRAPEFGDLDVLAVLLPAARKRGMKTYCWIIEDNVRANIPNLELLWEKDLYGRVPPRHPAGPCLNNPHYRAFVRGLLQDYCRSYEIDGIMWGAERQGPLGNSLGAFHNGGRTDPGRVTCFCEFCEQKARRMGINFERTKAGFRALETYVRAGRAGQRPPDGYYVAFWRILLEYPEILAWETFWTGSLREIYQLIFEQVKSIRKELPVGWHIWHNASFHPIYRAEQDFARMAPYSDYIKPVLYNNCAGERMASYIASVTQNIHGDLTRPELLEFEYRVMNYGNEASYDRLGAAGLSADYVYRETKRTVDAVAATHTPVWPGIDIDVPTGAGHSKCTPSSVREAVQAAFRGGAEGVLLSRNFAEMKPENLRAAGEAIEQLGFV